MLEIFEQMFKGQRIGQAANAFFEGLNDSRGPIREVLDELSLWGSHLAKNAVLKWVPRVMAGLRCQACADGCDGPGLILCDTCGRSACLSHARIDHEAEGTCAFCVELSSGRPARRPDRPPREAPQATPRRDDVDAALKTLGLKKGATWEEVHAQYKKLAFQHSPDRQTTDKGRAEKTERMKRVNAAYAVLEKRMRRAA